MRRYGVWSCYGWAGIKGRQRENIPKLKQQHGTKDRDTEFCIQNNEMKLGEHGGTWEMEGGVGNICWNKTGGLELFLSFSYISRYDV